MANWYAVNTKARQELCARDHLERQSFRTHLPMVRTARRRRGRWQSLVEPLFPGYLFVEIDVRRQSTGPIRSTRGVIGLVRFGGQPTPVPNGLVERLIDLQPNGAEPVDLDMLFQAGDEVAIVDGPFRGLKAIFEAPTTQDRVFVLLEILGKASRATLPIDQIAPAG